MCIIAAKPSGTKMPDTETIRAMWRNNPDGAGYMYAKDGKIRIEKGFMKLADLEASLAKTAKRVNLDDVSVVLHFRIKTHGEICPGNCHPFPVTRSVKALQSLSSCATLGIAHNGIIPIAPRKGISDTMEYTASQLAPLYAAMPDFYRNDNAIELVRNAIQSKLAIMNGEGEIVLIGDFNEKDGIKYSNYSYAASRWSYAPKYTSSHASSYLWDFDEPGYDDYEETMLMWADQLPDGSFMQDFNTGDLIDDICDILMDENDNLYFYDFNDDVAYPYSDAAMYLPDGNAAHFVEELASMERVFMLAEDRGTPPPPFDVAKKGSTKDKSKKSKKTGSK